MDINQNTHENSEELPNRGSEESQTPLSQEDAPWWDPRSAQQGGSSAGQAGELQSDAAQPAQKNDTAPVAGQYVVGGEQYEQPQPQSDGQTEEETANSRPETPASSEQSSGAAPYEQPAGSWMQDSQGRWYWEQPRWILSSRGIWLWQVWQYFVGPNGQWQWRCAQSFTQHQLEQQIVDEENQVSLNELPFLAQDPTAQDSQQGGNQQGGFAGIDPKTMFDENGKMSTVVSISWLILGFVGGIFGILIAWFLCSASGMDKKQRNQVFKYVVIGFLAWAVIMWCVAPSGFFGFGSDGSGSAQAPTSQSPLW